MTSDDWGYLTGTFTVHLLAFIVCSWVAIMALTFTTRLSSSKVFIGAFVLGHLAENLLLRAHDSRWDSVGFTLARLVGIPLMWLLLRKRVRRWVAERRSTSEHRADDAGESVDRDEK
jgi:hypothetical protein